METNDRLDLKVLSIDFDFFQDVDANTITTNYPDGVDVPPGLSSLIWTGHYAVDTIDGSRLLDSVNINTKLYNQIVHIIRNQSDSTIPVYVCCSHAHIYDIIMSCYPEYRDDFNGQLFIDHIDMHHDFENDDKEVNCGNWVGKILEQIPDAHIRWFTREVGTEVYSIDKEKLQPFAYDLQAIQDEHYNLIFLCRSDNWIPPHLDIWFDKLIQELLDMFDENIVVQENVSEPRNIYSILGNADKERDYLANVKIP